METKSSSLANQLATDFGELKLIHHQHELTLELVGSQLMALAATLSSAKPYRFEQLIDLCGVDYALYGRDEWATEESSGEGFSRAVEADSTGRLQFGDAVHISQAFAYRFASVVHLLSYTHNQRLRLRVFAEDDEFPVIPSLTGVWSNADWYEREAFDLFGIIYEGHQDLRRLLTDYGFVGHPFRKDFPLVGNVEMRYDPERGRVVYEPVSIQPRVLVPRVIRDDHRYVVEGDDTAHSQ